jgi:hypothetical protein
MSLWQTRNPVTVLFLVVLLGAVCLAKPFPQDEKESLGPRDVAAAKNQPHPLIKLMAEKPWQLRPELRGKHPRVFVTELELVALRQRAHGTHRDIWRQVLANLRALNAEPPAPPAEARRAQNTVGIAIAEAALAYKIEGDSRYLAAARKYMDAAVSYDVWGYSYNKPNVDLAAGHLLYGLGWGYDLLYNDLAPADRARYRAKLLRQGELLFQYYKPRPGRTYSYSQNHVFIPIAGLAVAAYALQGEVPEAENWARLARAMYDRILATYSPDGYYYEGFEYWTFSTPWIIHYLDAHQHSTGEDLYDTPGLRKMHLYVAHATLPGGKNAFDFGDIFSGPLTRTGHDDDLLRTHPNGRFYTNYNLLYRTASRFHNSEAQGVAAWLKAQDQVNAEDFWSLLWYDPKLSATPIEKLDPWYYFKDHEAVYWRSDWTPNATAIAFKCGPPEGHAALARLRQFPDWHLESGHAHPDANSFILFARGQYLTGDSGYAGVPATDQHNTLLVDGKGQANEGDGHDAWRNFPYESLSKLRIAEVHFAPGFVFIHGDAASTYAPELGIKRFDRSLVLTSTSSLMAWDDIESDKPHIFTSLLHADEQIETTDPSTLLIKAGDVKLSVNVFSSAASHIQIEPNYMTGPGLPGSVASGNREARGQRARISNTTPSTDAHFVYRMTVSSPHP